MGKASGEGSFGRKPGEDPRTGTFQLVKDGVLPDGYQWSKTRIKGRETAPEGGTREFEWRFAREIYSPDPVEQ